MVQQVVGNTNPQVMELLQQANVEMRMLGRETPTLPWFMQQASFLTVAGSQTAGFADQGDLETIAPGLLYVVNDTMWDEDLMYPIAGPLSQQEWQLQIARKFTGPYYKYTIWVDVVTGLRRLSFIPNPAAGDTVQFAYASQNGVRSNTGTLKQTFTADTDVAIMDERLIEAAVSWRWKKSKGYPDWVDFKADYDKLWNQMKGQDGGSKSFRMLSKMFVPFGVGLGNIQDGNFPGPGAM